MAAFNPEVERSLVPTVPLRPSWRAVTPRSTSSTKPEGRIVRPGASWVEPRATSAPAGEGLAAVGAPSQAAGLDAGADLQRLATVEYISARV
jgi:hypothetical protein